MTVEKKVRGAVEIVLGSKKFLLFRTFAAIAALEQLLEDHVFNDVDGNRITKSAPFVRSISTIEGLEDVKKVAVFVKSLLTHDKKAKISISKIIELLTADDNPFAGAEDAGIKCAAAWFKQEEGELRAAIARFLEATKGDGEESPDPLASES